jgi:enamine deaminase RidA (YjgF/YER057c/UK114 family)
VARDAQGNLVGKGDFGAQVRQVYTNLKNILNEAGGDLTNIVKMTTYLTHYANIEIRRRIHAEFFGDVMPPSTLLIIDSLASPDFMIEMEAIAVLD